MYSSISTGVEISVEHDHGELDVKFGHQTGQQQEGTNIVGV